MVASSCEVSNRDFVAFSSVVCTINRHSAVCKRCLRSSHVVIVGVLACEFKICSSLGVQGEHVASCRVCPLGGYRDELSYESFEPCPAVDTLDAPGEDVEQVEVEILEHGCCDKEHGVLVKEGEGEVRPSEVVVLAVEVAFCRTARRTRRRGCTQP